MAVDETFFIPFPELSGGGAVGDGLIPSVHATRQLLDSLNGPSPLSGGQKASELEDSAMVLIGAGGGGFLAEMFGFDETGLALAGVALGLFGMSQGHPKAINIARGAIAPMAYREGRRLAQRRRENARESEQGETNTTTT